MKIPFTRKIIESWGGSAVFREGMAIRSQHRVLSAEFDGKVLRGSVLAGIRPLRTSATVHDDLSCESHCPCPDNVNRGVICPHVIAVALAVLDKYNDPLADQKRLEELRRAKNMMRTAETDFFRRAAPSKSVPPVRLQLELGPDWPKRARAGATPLRTWFLSGGKAVPADEWPLASPLALSPADDNILSVLEDIAAARLPFELRLAPADFINVLELLKGRTLRTHRGPDVLVSAAPRRSVLQLDLDHENGELLLNVRTDVPGAREGEIPLYWTTPKSGWVFAAGKFCPLEKVLPPVFGEIYADTVSISRPHVPGFLKKQLPLLRNSLDVEAEVTADLFAFEPETPRFALRVQGSAASIALRLVAVYGDLEMEAGRPSPQGEFFHPDPDDLLRYTCRNLPAELRALAELERWGVCAGPDGAIPPVIGVREVANFNAGAIPALRRLGWRVEFSGPVGPALENAPWATPVIHVSPVAGSGFFDVRFEFDDGGEGLSPAEIQAALNRGDSFVQHDGHTVLFDSEAILSMREIFADCGTGEGTAAGAFRLPPVYSAYAASAMQGLDGVDVDAPPDWLRAAERNLSPKKVALDLRPEFETLLRPYQKDGVRWLRNLELNGFGGILADEMGLGKTLQTLVWISMLLENAPDPHAPVLVVCPTSLVDNWAAEAARFTPWLRVHRFTGLDRHARWEDARAADIVITSYAILRRDVALFGELDFAAAVLDEAQHIKNRDTQNSRAVRNLRARHRIVLTGTPIENGVSDLWSIMDFLMPGYLGTAKSFRQSVELPIAGGGPDAERAQWRLSKKLRPFLLRRLKKDVARDLPPKIERVAFCTLSPDQKKVYAALLEKSRREVADLVAAEGFHRARFAILRTLLRLRQVCCHLDLLKLPDLHSEMPSAKLDLFFELLDEALDGGHRVLVFSQFVSMLSILRQALDARGIPYCYLDGSTQNRLETVGKFNSDPSIPVFLISLKAGGTGLNLVGADMVIHFDPWWNPAVENQATDRAYRIGQKRTVYSVKLITRDSVEERVLQLQQRKQLLYDATLDPASEDGGALPDLTWEDVKTLLSL